MTRNPLCSIIMKIYKAYKYAERKRKYAISYYKKHRVRRREQIKAWQQSESGIASEKKHHKNRSYRERTNKQNRNKTPKSVFCAYRKGAKKRGMSFLLGIEYFVENWNSRCHYCGATINGIGVDRIDSSIGYQPDNVVICCTRCNFMKGSLSFEDFLAQCEMIYENHRARP